MQTVKCFSEIKFKDGDTCSQDQAWLKKVTEKSLKTDDAQVSFFTWRDDLTCAGSACHYNLMSLRNTAKFYLNRIQWNGYKLGGNNKAGRCSEAFAEEFLTWAHSKDSLWAEIMNRAVLLVNDVGKPMATLFLRPADDPIIPLCHFSITAGRTITEWPNIAKEVEACYEEFPDFRAALWWGYTMIPKGAYGSDWHKGFDASKAGIPKALLTDKPFVTQTTMNEGKNGTINVNKEYSTPIVPYTKVPTTIGEYAKQYELLKKKVK